MKYIISPRDDEAAFLRLIDIGFVTADKGKREFTFEEWWGKKDAKGRVIVKGINPVIVHRLMCDHTVTLSH